MEIAREIPPLYATAGQPFRDKLIRLRYFTSSGSAEWLVAEMDYAAGLLFGYADLGLGPGMAEWGYTDLAELASLFVHTADGWPVWVERDLH